MGMDMMAQIETSIEALWQTKGEDKTEQIIDVLESIRLTMNEKEMFIIGERISFCQKS